MLAILRRLFSREEAEAIPQRVIVIYAHAPEATPDLSSALEAFDPPFFPSDKVDQFSPEEFSAMAKVFQKADVAVEHLYRCNQPEMIPCVVYRLEDQQWIPDERATDFFHVNHINY